MGVRGRPVAWNDWYSTERWARIRRHQLLTHPLCAFSAERGLDHVNSHIAKERYVVDVSQLSAGKS